MAAPTTISHVCPQRITATAVMRFWTTPRTTGLEPMAVVDIGSNSVRLVVYEGAVRAPTPLFNEKIQCGLGRTLAEDGRLPEASVERAIAALQRFRALARTLRVKHLRVVATAAAREATNGQAFIERAEDAIRAPVEILSGEREAELAAAGILMGFTEPNGIAGDLGGGSLEVIDLADGRQIEADSLPLGALRLSSHSNGDLSRAEEIVEESLNQVDWLGNGRKRTLYLVGGTWRSLARLHMHANSYPIHVMHAYTVEAKSFSGFCRSVVKTAERTGRYDGDAIVSKGRRDLLPYGAIVAQKLVQQARPSDVVISASGIREGLVYSLLSENERSKDPLIEACLDLARRRSRSYEHALELKAWMDPLFGPSGIDETPEEERLRAAACIISDIGWRAHPDYRANQSLDTVINSALVSIDHPGRLYLALSIYCRHFGMTEVRIAQVPAAYRELVGARYFTRARVVAGAIRTAHMLSAGMPGIIDETRLEIEDGSLLLKLPPAHAALDGERLKKRHAALAKILGLQGQVIVTK